MRFNKSKAGRINYYPETEADVYLIDNLLCGAVWKNNGEFASVEDTLYNHMCFYQCRDNPTIKYNDMAAASFWLEAHKIETGLRGVNYPDMLYPTQIEDIIKMTRFKYLLNANKPGYGKTLEAIIYCKNLSIKRALIIAPKATHVQWKNAVLTHLSTEIPENRIQICPKSIDFDGNPLYVIMNYEKFISKQWISQLKDFNFEIVIADEAHRLRNAKAKSTMAIKQIKSTYRLALTGTPIVNKPDNLWSLFQWINPKYFGNSYWNFVERFCEVAEDFWGKQIVGLTKNLRVADMLHRTLQIVTVRQDGKLLDTDLVTNNVYLEMGNKQAAVYKDVRLLQLEKLKLEGFTVANGMDKVTKLMQVTSNPEKFNLPDNPKFDWLFTFLEDNPELKVVAFSRFSETILALEDYMQVHKIKCAIYHGGIKNAEREAEKAKFISDQETRLLCATFGCMSEGVDGLQEVAHHIVCIDRLYNPEENNQAFGRLYRRLQKENVFVWFLMFKKTVDERLEDINNLKAEDIQKLFM